MWNIVLPGKSFIDLYELPIEFYSPVLTLEHRGHTDAWGCLDIGGHPIIRGIWTPPKSDTPMLASTVGHPL